MIMPYLLYTVYREFDCSNRVFKFSIKTLSFVVARCFLFDVPVWGCIPFAISKQFLFIEIWKQFIPKSKQECSSRFMKIRPQILSILADESTDKIHNLPASAFIWIKATSAFPSKQCCAANRPFSVRRLALRICIWLHSSFFLSNATKILNK